MRSRSVVWMCCAALLMQAAAVSAQSLVIFPAKGQTPEQQARDEGECQAWARKNTGIDPLAVANEAAQQGAEAKAAEARAKLATFNRAYSACLEGKGYTVK